MKPATAVILGVGGLGCPAALALAESGAPVKLVLVDFDNVELSNLPRQILFAESDLGRPKALVGAERLSKLCEVDARVQRFAPDLLARADVLLDGSDNFETRFAANDAAVAAGVPLIHGAALGFRGQMLTVLPRKSACLRCLFEGPPPPGALPTCAEAGVLAPLCGVVGASMAEEALRILRGEPALSASNLITWDGKSGKERAVRVPRDPECTACRSP